LKNKILKCVGDPNDRINEDPLRILRALRFSITKDLIIDQKLLEILKSDKLYLKISILPIDRIRDELTKMFMYDTIKSINLLSTLPIETQKILFKDNLWLKPTLEKIKN
jgi:tRNA nucleotidyltransferase/poly(A) polymerase